MIQGIFVIVNRTTPMDIFSHGLYGGIAFGRKSKRDYVIAFLFGVAPDLLAFGAFFITSLFSSGVVGRPNLASIPSYVFSIYNFSHSLVVFALFFAIAWIAGKKDFAKLMLAWPLHILVDIPTHDTSFFPTPFLWPISHFSIDGTSWGQPLIFVPNVILLVCLYTIWYVRRKKVNHH
jgi:hypothetical protein